MSFNIPNSWFVAGNSPKKYEMGVAKGAGQNGKNAATIKSIEQNINGFGTLMQMCNAGEYAGKKIKMRCSVKSTNVTGWAGVWLRVDQAYSSQPLAFDNMHDRAIKGTTDWTKYEIVLDVPANASILAFGVLLSGPGQIWFDNITFELVFNGVKSTNSRNSVKPDYIQNEPTNLDFEKGFNNKTGLFNQNLPSPIPEQTKNSTLKLGNGIKVNDFQLGDVSKWYGLQDNLTFAYNKNNLTFNFIDNPMNQSKNVKYFYNLEGMDDKWSEISTSNEATYRNLPPGDYIFKVRAMNSEGYCNNEFQYPFTIRPTWWTTWWAYSFYVLLAGSIVYFLYRNRTHQLENKQEAQIKTMVATQEDERKRISRDLHDDIGTKLSALKLFISSLGQKAADTNNNEIKSLAATSEQFIKEVMQDVRQLLLNLSPTVLEEFGYTAAVEGLINKINETKQIQFNLVVFGMKQRMKKDYELALYRITQELINNVLKHAQAKKVSLQIGLRDEKIILMIEDDGLGFDVNCHRDGYGLNNLSARTKLMHGTIAIDSHPGKGTSVLIEIPYHSNVNDNLYIIG